MLPDQIFLLDSCMNFQCKRGHICKADQQGKPHCVCQDSVTCPPTKLLDQVSILQNGLEGAPNSDLNESGLQLKYEGGETDTQVIT